MLSDEVKYLEEKNDRLKNDNFNLRSENERLKKKIEALEECCKMVIPNNVYTHKARKNTTVKFLDGSQQTVRLKAGEKDCIETAIAYCLLKQVLSAKEVRKLVEEREEH